MARSKRILIIGSVAAIWTLCVYPVLVAGMYFAGMEVSAVNAMLSYVPGVLGVSGVAGWLFRRRK